MRKNKLFLLLISSNDIEDADNIDLDSAPSHTSMLDSPSEEEADTSSGDTSESESETSRDSDSVNEPDIDAEIYPNSRITIGESILAILMLIIRHKVSKKLLSAILAIINLHCPVPTNYLKSLYRFNQFFANLSLPIKRHFFCSECLSQLATQSQTCPECKKPTAVSYFLEIPILLHLAKMFKRPGFYDSLNARFIRKKHANSNYEDIWDGDVYQSLSSNNGFLSNRNNISFTWNTDGISIFESSKFSVWPMYLVINELPYKERFKQENVLLTGLWFGAKKPAANLFLNFLREPLKELYKGVEFSIHGLAQRIIVRGIIICGTCDMPAKACFLNMHDHKGIFGCMKCKIQSKNHGRTRVYRYKKNIPLRTSEETVYQGIQAHEQKKPCQGVKGPTIISKITHDFIRTTAIDTMHCVYLGVVKSLFMLWFDVSHRNCPFSLYKFCKFVNARIQKITPPSCIPRLPRSLFTYHYWKATEFKAWLLYYSLPILSFIMDKEYFEHHKLLVLGISLLSQSSISPAMIDQASSALEGYVSQFEKLYGIRNMTCNLHCILHLADVVREFGPLNITSCFIFEHLNGGFRRLVHGTKYAQLQMCSAVSSFNYIADLKTRLTRISDDVIQFSKQLEYSGMHRRKLTPISANTFIFGQLNKLVKLSDEIIDALLSLGINRSEGQIFTRLFKNGLEYDSTMYNETKRKKTNSSVVKYSLHHQIHVGIVYTFIKLPDNKCNDHTAANSLKSDQYIAMIEPCSILESPVPNLLKICEKTPNKLLEAVEVSNILTVCFAINADEDSNAFFVIDPVNTLEFE